MNFFQVSIIALSVVFLTACDSKKNHFIKACKENASKRACQCVYDELENQYGKEQFSRILDNEYWGVDLDAFQKNSLEAVYKCSGLDLRR